MEIEGRKYAQFNIQQTKNGYQLIDVPYENYQGWSNSATWCFSLYFNQNKRWIDALRSIPHPKYRTLSWAHLSALFYDAQNTETDENIQIDEDCEGLVNVQEFLANFFQEAGEGVNVNGKLLYENTLDRINSTSFEINELEVRPEIKND